MMAALKHGRLENDEASLRRPKKIMSQIRVMQISQHHREGMGNRVVNQKMTPMSWRLPTKRYVKLSLVPLLFYDILIGFYL